jgi:hypothetical protein
MELCGKSGMIALSLLFLTFLNFCHFVHTRTQADALNSKFVGEFALLRAAIDGDLDRLQLAIQRHPNVDCVLTKEIGERYLKLGKIGIDFPSAPALHLAISGGTQNHLRVAHRLLLAGADINYFNFSQSDSSFPPPIYFGLGAFHSPTPTHSGILYAIFSSYGDRFKYSTIVTWVKISRYPPPLHTCVFFNNIDGIFLLSSLPDYDMNERDHESLTALHIAAWLGNFVQVSFLLQKGADPLARDIYNRTFLHYCAIRGISSIPTNILNRPSALLLPIKRLLVNAMDNENMTALDIARLPPAQSRVIKSLEQFLDIHSPEDDEKCQMIASLNSTLDATQFRRDFLMTQRPVKFIGNLTSSCKFWSRISNRSLFLERYGSLIVDVELNSSSIAERDTIEGFYRRSCINSKEVHSFCFKVQATATTTLPNSLYLDFTSHSILNFFDACPLPSVTLRIYSGFISGLPLRSHSAAWNVLLEGASRVWYFISPGTALDLILSIDELNQNSEFDRENPLKPELSLEEWENKILPLLRKHKVVASVIQRLGDVIFIPHGWSYVMIGSDGDIDTMTTICESTSQSAFDQVPIGVRLYGKSMFE